MTVTALEKAMHATIAIYVAAPLLHKCFNSMYGLKLAMCLLIYGHNYVDIILSATKGA